MYRRRDPICAQEFDQAWRFVATRLCAPIASTRFVRVGAPGLWKGRPSLSTMQGASALDPHIRKNHELLPSVSGLVRATLGVRQGSIDSIKSHSYLVVMFVVCGWLSPISHKTHFHKDLCLRPRVQQLSIDFRIQSTTSETKLVRSMG